jgi:DNA end-binding protein Ku
MAEQLVDAMAGDWQPDLFHDEFREKLMELVEQKSREGGLRQAQPLPGEEVATTAEVIDLTELLKRSLRGKPGTAPAAAPVRPAAKKSGAKRVAANDEAPARKERAVAARKAATGTRASAAVKPAARRKAG